MQQLKDKAGLTDEQAAKALKIMREYALAKVPPMFSGIVDNFFGSAPASDDVLDHI